MDNPRKSSVFVMRRALGAVIIQIVEARATYGGAA